MPEHQHNDPLEEFFKKKVQEYDIEYNEEDWLKLENRLDAVEQQQSYWKRYAAAAAVILLFSLLGYMTYQQQQKINQLNERLSNNEQFNRSQSAPGEILPYNLFVLDQPANQSSATSSKDSNSEQDTDNLTDGPVENSTNEDEPGTNQQDEYQQPMFTQEQALALANISEFPTLEGMNSRSNTADPPVFRSGSIIQNQSKNQPALNSNAPATSSSAFSSQNMIGQHKQSQFSVGILGGPDLSTVGGVSNFYNPGYKIGVSVEYNISQNLALSVGAIHSKVQYTARGNAYNPPQGYWSYGQVPSKTTGVCVLIDIPLSLKYNFLHFDKSRIFATGGISSYIMLNEDYQFTYDSYSSGQLQRWNEDTGTVHLMSNASISVGYEYDINRNISFRAEPFLRVPIREVGWGNVNLYSVGSLISLNYKL